MKKWLHSTIALLSIVGCGESQSSSEGIAPLPPRITSDLALKLEQQENVRDQFSLLLEYFELHFDRSDLLTGVDENVNGIRDDIEAVLNALNVSEPVRKALKQDARYQQENLYHDFSNFTYANVDKAAAIANMYNEVIACKVYVGMSIDDRVATSKHLADLTYNTFDRAMAYLAYESLLDGVFTNVLPPEEQYCD
ncbi:chromosome partitioning protein ParA [Vibrio sp. TRT 17S01]|uniref:chromosome partitioning protein ParA n=1 Tax=Vibrio sp. TRT 17S01 TaxID=3418505 RepID=UPI003CEC27F2